MKLCKENVGKTFELDKDWFSVKYKIIDTSFDHEYGTQRQYDYEIISVSTTAGEEVDFKEIERAVEKDIGI